MALYFTEVKKEFIAPTSVHNHNTRLQKKENYYLPCAKTSYEQNRWGLEVLNLDKCRNCIKKCNWVYIKKK